MVGVESTLFIKTVFVEGIVLTTKINICLVNVMITKA